MNRRNPCGICGDFGHLDSECYLAEPEREAPDYNRFIERCNAIVAQVAAEEAAMSARVNNSLEPKRRRAA